MRKELLNFDWYTYHLSVEDYDYTIELVDRILADRQMEINRTVKKIERKNKRSKSLFKDDTSEEISDAMYYSHIDGEFLWHFAIWRLQGIFEGILSQNFPITSNGFGLKSKLDKLKKCNITIASNDYIEILEWAKLRNALSHSPPEQFRPGNLSRNDVLEYLELLKKVTLYIVSQK